MRFHLSEEQTAIQAAVRGTLADCWPMDRLHTFADGADDFDPASWNALMALGLGGILLPDSGMGLLDAALVSEVAGEAAAPGPLIGQLLTVAAVARSGNAAARAHLDALVAATTVAALALGNSPYVQSARAAQVFLVGSRETGLALVEAGAGVTIEPVKPTDRSRPVSRVTFDGAVRHELFAAGDPMAAQICDAALVLIAADSLGGALHCTDISVAYAKEREQFGQPIGQFQGLKHQLAQMALDAEPARALVWYAAYAHDAALDDAPRAAAMAKAHLCDVYVRSTRAAIAAHGGIGYTWEYGLNYWFRRAAFNRAWLGSPAEHRARAADLAGW
ncbi:acyl-CoA dehydrogenase family protein [Novosphingobium sp.]|uniref:acyl-CoA dehydrogenase family protein n=1 Tax=Novosphingobium sp. TaxID=1874826 RepID=UPI002734B826|nr:acyl-CoA dehydrogenase family protein [Novosphingobium sp.]MDP3906007.1 acyl-CoA dehydrogenase family protein [Novosphingobium sp.]